MPESPTKLQSSSRKAERAESPTKSGSYLSVANGNGARRAASSPIKKAVSPFRRSPTKIDNATVPEVREQARQVLEKFLQRSLSENSATRGNAVRKSFHRREGSDLARIKESGSSSNLEPEELASPTERRSSYIAAVSEDQGSSGKNDERKPSVGSVGSQKSTKSHSMTVTKDEKIQIKEHLKSKKQRRSKDLGDSMSPTETVDYTGFTPNSTGQSRQSADQLERETSDDEDSVQRGRRKKSKFQQAKSRIRDSFLRKQRLLGSTDSAGSASSSRTPTTETPSRNGSTPRYSKKPVPEIRKKSPTPENEVGETAANGTTVVRGSTDFDDESPSAGYKTAVHANSSPDGLNRINRDQEKKAKTSFWDWFRPAKRKTKQKDRQKSRSLDALTNPSYAVNSDKTDSKLNRLFSDEGPRHPQQRHLHKKHSFSGRCSFSGKTNGGIDRTSLKLSGLRVNKPRTPDANDQKRVFPSDVVTDSIEVDRVDAESPLEIPFHERTEEEKEFVYDLVADRLAEIASNYRDDPTSPVEAVAKTDQDPGAEDKEGSISRDIINILQGTGDRHLGPDQNKQIEQVMLDAVKSAGYSKFRKELKKATNNEPNLQQLAWFFDVTTGAIKMAGAGGQLAMKVKEFSLRYFEDRFADWIIGRGGWDSMLSDEDGGTGGEEDVLNF